MPPEDRYYLEDPELVPRAEYERDRDRILYATAFRRLDGVTQVAAADEVALFHNRLTHSLKVGQVGRKIAATINFLASGSADIAAACQRYTGLPASTLGIIDPWILETAGMAHDLGHPPFGHIAESALQKAVGSTPNKDERLLVPEGFSLPDSFEGNAQSFRIVTKLAFGRIATAQRQPATDDIQVVGLNLTRASLSAILKYPWRCLERPPGVAIRKQKWGAYDSERDILQWAINSIPAEHQFKRERSDGSIEYRSLTAQAMDWADDITYAVHDVEDFCRAGLIPADLLRESGRRGDLSESVWIYCLARLMGNVQVRTKLPENEQAAMQRLRAIYDDTISLLPELAVLTRSSREKFRSWSSGQIDFYTSPGPSGLLIDARSGSLDIAIVPLVQVEILKQLTWFFVIERAAFGAAQRGQARVVRELFVWLCDWVTQCYRLQFGTPEVRRNDYHLGGLPTRLIDTLDVSFWDYESGSGYRSEGECVARGVCDYIASLTERQALELHSRLNGSSRFGMLDGSFEH